MKQKPLIVIMVVMLALGCTDDINNEDYVDVDCSQFDENFNCSSGGIILINETIDIRCINYLINMCHGDKFVVVGELNNSNATASPKPLSEDIDVRGQEYTNNFVRNYTDSEIEQMNLENKQRYEEMIVWYEMSNSEECNIEYKRVYELGGFYTCMKCENDTIWIDSRNLNICGGVQ